MSQSILKFTWLSILAGLSLAAVARAQDRADAPAADKSAADLRLEDPAVRSVILSNPKTPAEVLRAILVLADLDRAVLAKPMLASLAEAKLNSKTLIDLSNQFDTAALMKLAGNPELAPQGAELADSILAAVEKQRQDPAQLNAWVNQLADPKEGVRRKAAEQLRAAREAAVGPLLRALADPKRAGLHPAAMVVMSRLGGEAAGPLAAALNSKNTAIALAAARALGQTRATAATADVLVVAFTGEPASPLRQAAGNSLANILGHRATADEAREFLVVDIGRLLDDARKHRLELEPIATTWRWNEKSLTSVPANLTPSGLAFETAGRYAQALRSVAQGFADERLCVEAELAAAKYLSPDRPLPTGPGSARDAAAQRGVQVVEGVLIEAMAKGQLLAATAAAEVLGDIGSEALLDTAGAARSPLAEAARSGNRRLRFAAIDSILRIQPTQPFSGDSSVVDSLQFFAATSGERRVLVGHPRSTRGQEIAGLLASQGYRADVATNARDLMELASTSPDYELALVDVSLNTPPVDDLIGRLRRDPRTADLPIGLMVGEEQKAAVQRLAATMPAVVAIARVGDDYSTQFEIERVLASVGRDHVGFETRQAEAGNSLVWLAKLAEHRTTVFNVERTSPSIERALYVPAWTAAAATVLADLPSENAQRSLLALANEDVMPAETRKIGAVAFGRNVRQFGCHLTIAEIRKQYDRYNASRYQDREVQAILASVLDAIEAQAVADAAAEANQSER